MDGSSRPSKQSARSSLHRATDLTLLPSWVPAVGGGSYRAEMSTEPIPIRSAAYPVPFLVVRPAPGRVQLVNRGAETLRCVVFLVLGPGVLDAQVVGSVAPGDVIETRVHGRDLERSTSLVVRWFREDDEEYLWRIAF